MSLFLSKWAIIPLWSCPKMLYPNWTKIVANDFDSFEVKFRRNLKTLLCTFKLRLHATYDNIWPWIDGRRLNFKIQLRSFSKFSRILGRPGTCKKCVFKIKIKIRSRQILTLRIPIYKCMFNFYAFHYVTKYYYQNKYEILEKWSYKSLFCWDSDVQPRLNSKLVSILTV